MPEIDRYIVNDIPLEQLRTAPWNANIVPPETLDKIKHSIETYGIVENLIVRPRYGGGLETGDVAIDHYEVISGNHRLQLYRELGLSHAPCVILELDDADAYMLSEVLNHTRGKDDPDLYKTLLRDINQTMPAGDMLLLLNENAETLQKLLVDQPPVDPTPPNWQGRFELVIELEDEKAQAELYQKLTDQGYHCRVLTM